MASAHGKNPDLRVSDADRDTIVSELGQHFQDGRLDQDEFDLRVTSALTAKTQHDLDRLVIDLPQPGPAGQPAPAGRQYHRLWPLIIVPLLLGAVLVAGVVSGDWHHHGAGGWPFAPFGLLWLIIPALVVRARIRGRQWR